MKPSTYKDGRTVIDRPQDIERDYAGYAARLRETLNREKLPQHGRYIYDPRTGEIVYLK